MTYGSVLASFNVEEFGTERVQRLTRDEIDARFEEFRRMTALTPVTRCFLSCGNRVARPWNSRFGATTHGGASCPGADWLSTLRQSNVSSCSPSFSSAPGRKYGLCRFVPKRSSAATRPSAVNGTSARR